MDKIKELKSRLRYNKNNSYLLTGKDVKTIIDLLADTSNYSVKTLKLEYTASQLLDLTDKTLLDLTGTNDAIELLSVSANLVGTPMDVPGTIYVYLGEPGTAVGMYTGGPCDLTNQYYYFRRIGETGFNDLNKQKICISNQGGLSGGDTDTLLTIYITYATHAN